MYELQKLNVVKIVATEAKRDKLLAQGFALVEKPAKPDKPKADKPRGNENKNDGDGE